MFFSKILKEKVWGGRQFSSSLGIGLPDERLYGESWEVSAHKNGVSVVQNGRYSGMSLEEMVKRFGATLVGKEVFDKFGEKFPLLIKYLDINDKLSLQVHPDDFYALEAEGEFGKCESWYVLEATEDAELILGIAEGIDKDTFSSRVRSGDFNNLFRTVKVKKGDFIDVNPGLVHGSLNGSILLCEVQQNSDSTYRIYDFDRYFNGVKRDLHIEKSLDVIDFLQSPVISSTESRSKKFFDGGFIEELSRTPYYKIDRIKLNGGSLSKKAYKNFYILSILSGAGSIESVDGQYKSFSGDTFLIPANVEITIEGDLDILKSYI